MKKTIFVALALCCAICWAQQELNFPFKATDRGIPEGWELNGKPDKCEVKNDEVTLAGDSKGEIYIYRPNIGLSKDKTYILSCEAKCLPGGDFMIYYEYILNGQWRSHVYRNTGKGEWQNVKLRFYKDDVGPHERIMLRLMNKTTLEVRNLRIAEEKHNHGVTDSFPPSAPITRFIHNGSFEWYEKYWDILSDAGVIRSDDDYGNTTLRLGKNGFVVQQSIHLLPNRKYRITWYAKPQNEEEATLQLALRYMPAKQLFSDNKYYLKPGSYKRFFIDFKTPDVKDPIMDIILRNDAHKPLLLSQFYLKEFSDEEMAPLKIKLNEPHYRDSIYASMPCDSIRGKIDFGGGITDAEVALSGKGVKTTRRLVNADAPEFEFPARNLPVGEYQLTVSATVNGKRQQIAEKVIHKYPHQKNEIVIGKDMNFYCDGKRYFPFLMGMMYEDPEKPVMSYLTATRGMTGRVGGGIGDAGAALLALDKAQRFGLKTMLWIGGDFTNTDDYEVKLRELFERIMTPEVVNHPALFAYNYCDEPWAREIPAYKFEAAARIMRELDPYHPFFINESPRGVVPEYLADYAQYSDIYGVDLYPLPATIRHSAIANKSMAAVGEYSDIYNAATDHKKPVLMWLQGYQWHPDGDPAAVFPNAQELKFMLMDSLMHGTKAIMMFNHKMMKHVFYKDLFSVTGLVSAYEPVIATGEVVGITSRNDGLRINSYKYNGDLFHLVLNESAKELVLPKDRIGKAKLVYGYDIDEATLTLKPWGFSAFSDNGAAPKSVPPLAKFNKEFEAEKDSFLESYYNRRFPKELSEAEWIWYPGSVADNPKVSLDRRLKLDKKVKSVIVSTTADNILKFSIDGKLILESGTWNVIHEMDVTSLIKPDGSTLHIDASNLDGPAALMMLIKVTYADGTVETFGSNSTWDISNGKTTIKAQSFGKVGHASTWGWTSLEIKKHPKF